MTPEEHIPLSPEAQEAIQRQLEAFRKKFGRDPSPDDPIFFDPSADQLVPLSNDQYEQMVLAATLQAGIDQAFLYAFKRTGRMVTETNRHLLS